ncbi:UDP-N-acetylglucosamine 2-epimerase [Maricaulaceae bacterium EIL42A08]|nr:UDP-N-acetylglucosamine 2-epimerase [Maricaulaceae bacterium EIL42A08]
MRFVSIVGARPNFIKLAPIVREAAGRGLDHRIINSNQHSDEEMNRRFFQALSLPEPNFICKAFNGSPAARFGRMIETIGIGLNTIRPDMVLVYGDVATTAAGAIAARLINLPVAHYGAGVRSGDDNMLEEFNRKLVDSVSDLLLTPHESCASNLIAEGVSGRQIFNVGNLLVDAAELFDERFAADQSFGSPYVLVTLHRPETVDDPDRFITIFEAICEGCEGLDIVFPIHPRTERLINEHRLNLRQVHKSGQVHAIPTTGILSNYGPSKRS